MNFPKVYVGRCCKREPLTADEANRLAQVCQTHEERLIVWTLLDTGLRVSEFCGLSRVSIDWQAHILRHTFSVTCVQKGISLPALQRLLGHDHLSTTEIYLNLSPEHVVDEFRAKW